MILLYIFLALVPNQRHSVAYLPDGNTATISGPMPQSRSYHDYYDGSRSGSTTPTASEAEAKYDILCRHPHYLILLRVYFFIRPKFLHE